jgi:hypothetical protein
VTKPHQLLAAILLLLSGVAAIAVFTGGIPAFLIIALTLVSAVSAVILVLAAIRPPRIGALVERAVIALDIVFVGVVYSLVAWDTDLGRVVLSTEIARVAVRFAVVTLLALPAIWTAMLITGNLGEMVRDPMELRTQCNVCGKPVTLSMRWTGTRLEPYRVIAEHQSDGQHTITPMWRVRS